jgi:hypothetical protein
VLKEAKPEKRQPFAENNSMAVLKDAANRGPTVSSSASRCPAFSSSTTGSLTALYVCNTMQQMDKHTHGKGRDKPTYCKKQVSMDAAKYFQLQFKQVGVLMLICAFTIYVQKKQSTQIVTGQQQLGESRPALNSIQRKAVKPQTVSRVAASSTRTTKTARFARTPC